MNNWYDVIKQSGGKTTKSIYLLDNRMTKNAVPKQVKPISMKRNQYWLGEVYPSLYLTQREAECIYYLARGLTIVATAHKLELSPRTVEFYLKKVKEKLNIKKKSHLVQRLYEIGYVELLLKQLEW